MKNAIKILFLFSAIIFTTQFFVSCGTKETATDQQKVAPEQNPSELMSDDALIKRGEHMVMSTGCAHCHSPKKFTAKGPEPDMDLWLAGHPADSKMPTPQPAALKAGWVLFTPDLTAFVGPWGTSFAANLTPDTASGIGVWTEKIFFTAIRKGKFHGLEAGRDMLPPMPWMFYKNMTDDDLRAIFAYLKSIKPIRNVVPAPIPPQGS